MDRSNITSIFTYTVVPRANVASAKSAGVSGSLRTSLAPSSSVIPAAPPKVIGFTTPPISNDAP
ncbi:hypothetical protein [Xanthomonas graminis]|uniref:hypothetical protein n=1 Tax=Xanthomonas graminis TaxID=3390026 RepID=UPI001E50F9B6|nr:hypothetical protein [Xanthomonas translucens]